MARTIAKDHDRKRIKILDTAAMVFARDGIARASMSSVAKECAMSKANIYHYYDSKDDLLFDILDTYLSALRDRICRLPSEGMSPTEKLNTTVSEILLAYDGMDNEHKIQIEGLPFLKGPQQTILRNYQREMVAQLSLILTEVSPQAFAQNPSHLHATTMSVFGMLNWYYMWNQSEVASGRVSYANLVTQLITRGAG